MNGAEMLGRPGSVWRRRPSRAACVAFLQELSLGGCASEVNSFLLEEIMDTGMSLADAESIAAVIVSSSLPSETEPAEVVSINSTGDCSHAHFHGARQCPLTTLTTLQ
ncbi:Protein lin-54 like protein [Fukomys damarensis]|uniref:Protein lin-54 like protein n=1 Tax=Fukomys damarensis TaxID=885580 RepID=A0A091CWN1_FUKDA|nr:Protein lin-54 like protein [Fukomys damarensis]